MRGIYNTNRKLSLCCFFVCFFVEREKKGGGLFLFVFDYDYDYDYVVDLVDLRLVTERFGCLMAYGFGFPWMRTHGGRRRLVFVVVVIGDFTTNNK